jgi:PIN domain nuclease of toxin-antitoxin system
LTGVLFDTQAYLWAAGHDVRLSRRAREVFEDRSIELWLSTASIWEMAIKRSLGKLRTPTTLGEMLRRSTEEQGIRLCPVEACDALRVEALPFHHRDPFDRLLVAQALERGLGLVSIDVALDAYGVERIW